MINEIITPQNCDSYCTKQMQFITQDRSTGQAAAWFTVINYCLQNGMPENFEISSIEAVISFIDNLIKNQK